MRVASSSLSRSAEARARAFACGAIPLPRRWQRVKSRSAGSWPDQQITLRQAPIVADSLQLFTLAGSSWQAWTLVNDFGASTRTDYHFVVLDAETGAITF